MPEHPEGSVTGLCSASSIIASLEMAFFSGWAFGPDVWQVRDIPVLILAVGGVAALLCVPFLATSSTPRVGKARRFFAVGAASTLASFAWALALAVLKGAS